MTIPEWRLGLFSVIILLLGLLAACSDAEEETAGLPEAPDDGVRSESFGVTYLFSDSARVTAKMEVAHLIEKEEEQEDKKSRENIMYLEDSLHISFLGVRGAITSEVTASRGTYYKDKGLAVLEGNVEMTNIRGERMQTEKLYWDERKEAIYNHTFVRIETANEFLECDSGLTANTDFTRWRLRGGVSGIASYPKN
ncbi:MAG: LPS export ABC transporter periplasmic protein LptC [Bacteroidia bacterium]